MNQKKKMEINKIYQGDCLEVLKTFPDESINCVMTSPPYLGLRDYGVKGQLGLEPTFQEYITKLCDIFDEIKRVLKKEGTCWVNLGDTYASSGGPSRHKGYTDPKYVNGRNGSFNEPASLPQEGILPKSLCQIPSRFAIEMSNRGWILRNEIIWHKPNCMPQSTKDRFTVDFEKVFFFSKSKKYFFEQQFDKANTEESVYRNKLRKSANYNIKYEGYKNNFPIPRADGLKNKRTVWSITTKPFKEAHFATFPKELVRTPIKAGCPDEGVVLDPFFGSGTTGVEALSQGKKFIGIELNPDYIKIAKKRLKPYLEQKKLI